MIAAPTERQNADAPVPPAGTEQAAADQAENRQQPPPAEAGVIDTGSSVVDGITDVVSTTVDIFSIYQ